MSAKLLFFDSAKCVDRNFGETHENSDYGYSKKSRRKIMM